MEKKLGPRATLGLTIALLLCLVHRSALAKGKESRRRVRAYRGAADRVSLRLKQTRRYTSKYCGAYAAAMVTRHLGQPIKAKRFISALYSERRQGISNRALAAYLRREGFDCFNLEGTTDDLFGLLKAGIAPILVVKSVGTAGFHYVVVGGLAPSASLILLHNPFSGRELLTFDELEKAWKPTTHTILVIAKK